MDMDAPRFIEEFVPRVAAVVEDVLLGIEHAVRQPVVAHELPDVFMGIQRRPLGRQRHERDIRREPGRHAIPSVEPAHHAAPMVVFRAAHRRVILFFWPMRASSANQISILVGSRPLSLAISATRAGKFFYIPRWPVGLCMMTRTRRELLIAHGPQFPAQPLLGHRDRELSVYPLAKVDDPPAHHAMIAGIGPLSMMTAGDVRCAALRRDGCPGACGRGGRPAHAR